MLSDPQLLATVAISALAVGAGGLKLAQAAIKKGHKEDKEIEQRSIGRISIEAFQDMLEEAARNNTNEKILPILRELKEISGNQVKVLQELNLILVELVTISRIGRKS